MAVAAGVPSTRHWCGLSYVVVQFGKELVLENVADLQGLLGAKRYRAYFRDCLGAVGYEIDGKKELFFPGSESDYPLREMVVFLNNLRTAVDVRVLVACHDGTVQSKALVESFGGRGAVSKSLHQFRANLPGFLEAHSSVLCGRNLHLSIADRRGTTLAVWMGRGTAFPRTQMLVAGST